MTGRNSAVYTCCKNENKNIENENENKNKNESLKNIYAMKILYNSFDQKNTFENEILILKKINHENIIKMIDNYTLKDQLFIILELMNKDLYDYISDGCGEFKERKNIIHQIVVATEFLHR
jgi:serine/threonine protein kinase